MSGHVIHLQDDQTLPKELKCAYCELVLNDPVETSESGLRFCAKCHDKAPKDLYRVYDFDIEDIFICIPHVEEQIANLKVKCENYMVGCDWKGLFKQLMQHAQECQYVTVECRNPGCGQKVPLTKRDEHLKECPRRHVNCKDCGKEMCFIELQDHSRVCPNATRKCKNCSKEMVAFELVHHMFNDCEHIKCVCKDEQKTYQVGNQLLHDHLQDVSKLADHLGPLICEFTKMSEALKEMNIVYHLLTNKVETTEKRNNILEVKVVQLEKEVEYLKNLREKTTETKTAKSEKSSLDTQRSSPLISAVSALSHEMAAACTEQTVLLQPNNSIHCERHNSMTYLKAIEERLAESERNIKFLQEQLNCSDIKACANQIQEYEDALATYKVRCSELEELSTFTCTTNGEYLWHIPEVNEKICNARSGHSIYIESPPFYTGRNGYKMCIRAYLNGDGTGKGTHLSIFFVLMRGVYDPLLQWPFDQKVNLILVDQDHKSNLERNFQPNQQSCSFQRPKTDMNVASGCPEFADLSVLDNTSYVKDNTMFIRFVLDN